MHNAQTGILADVPAQARYLIFSIDDPQPLPAVLKHLAAQAGNDLVVGIGPATAKACGKLVPGLHAFPVIEGALVDIPSSQADLWCWLRGSDRGHLVHRTHALVNGLADAFRCEQIVDAFRFDIGRDLSGYEDGTENPEGAEAMEAAIVQGSVEGLNGSSFVAVQQWVHNLDDFLSRPIEEQDETIGRRKSDNEEIGDAPDTAHVKRTAQEDFDPEAFIVRRSMPWADAAHEGLMFVAFGHSFDAYEALLTRMSGAEDGQVDALFGFTTPVSGSYFWCPPVRNGQLDLRALGI